MESLISNTDFGIYLKSKNISDLEYRKLRDNYDSFLSKSIELYQFVPCKLVDGVWVVLEEPEMIYNVDVFGVYNGIFQNKNEYIKEYQQAKERCLFEGFEFQDANEDYPMPFVFLGEDVTLYTEIFDETSKVEDLVYYSEFIQLTPIAQKQIGCDH